MKLNFMNTHRVVQNSLEPYRSSKSSQKQSKSADMAQTRYAIEKILGAGIWFFWSQTSRNWPKINLELKNLD